MARKPKKAATKKQTATKAAIKKAVEDLQVDTPAKTTPLEKKAHSLKAGDSCGAALKALREERGWSIAHVASSLRLSVSQIVALEADDFARLPEAIIVKGFIRNYAKLLNTPAEPIVSAFMQHAPETRLHKLTLKPSVGMKLTRQKRNMFYYIPAVLALLLGFFVWVFYQKYIQKPSTTELVTELSDAAPVLPEVVALPAEKKIIELAHAQPLASLENQVGADLASQINDGETVQPAQEVTDLPIATDKKRVEIEVMQKTWVGIVNASGAEVYSKILFAGDHATIDVAPPMKIVFGNARGATLTVNGGYLDLAPYTRANVARVSVD